MAFRCVTLSLCPLFPVHFVPPHLVIVPKYPHHITQRGNFRQKWRGHLWQGRFASFVLDHDYLLAAARYIERNPVRAGLAKRAEQWPWSSAAAHLAGQDDALVKVAPLLKRVANWRAFLGEPDPADLARQLHTHENTGRPLGSKAAVARLEAKVGRRPLAAPVASRSRRRNRYSVARLGGKSKQRQNASSRVG